MVNAMILLVCLMLVIQKEKKSGLALKTIGSNMLSASRTRGADKMKQKKDL